MRIPVDGRDMEKQWSRKASFSLRHAAPVHFLWALISQRFECFSCGGSRFGGPMLLGWRICLTESLLPTIQPKDFSCLVGYRDCSKIFLIERSIFVRRHFCTTTKLRTVSGLGTAFLLNKGNIFTGQQTRSEARMKLPGVRSERGCWGGISLLDKMSWVFYSSEDS